jgi:hypothetical protein
MSAPSSPSASPGPSPRRVPRWLLVVGSLIALYALFGFVVLPRILKAQLESRLPPLLHRKVAVREVAFNPFDVSLALRGFVISEKDGSTLLGFEELYVDVAMLRMVRGGVRIAEIRLVQPQVGVSILEGGKLSIADLLEPKEGAAKSDAEKAEAAKAEAAKAEAEKKEGGEKKAPPVIEIGHFSLDRGVLAFADLNRPEPFRARFEPLSIVLDGFTTAAAAGKDGAWDFKARLEPSTELEFAGSVSVTPLRSSGTVKVKGIQLSAFAPYLDESTQLKITQGLLDLALTYRFDASQAPTVIAVDDGLLRVAGLRVDRPWAKGATPPAEGDALVRLDEFKLSGLAADVGTQKAKVGQVLFDGARIHARRDEQGVLELLTLSKPLHPKPKPPPPAKPGPPWVADVAEIKISRGALLWEDRVPAAPAKLKFDEFELKLGPYRFPDEVPSKLDLSMRMFEAGKLTVGGTVHAGSGAAEVEVGLDRLPLAPLQPYVAESINGAIASGAFDLHGRVAFTPAKEKGGASRTHFAGGLGLSAFSLTGKGGHELLGVERMALEKLDTDTGTLVTTLGRFLLKGARVHFKVEADHTSEFATLAKPKKKAKAAGAAPVEEAASAEAAPSADVTPKAAAGPAADHATKGPVAKTLVQTIAIENFALDFTDRSVEPPFLTRLTQVTGAIGPFAQPGPAKTKIDLSGKLDGARLLASGWVKPAGKDSDLDLVFSLAPWNLTTTTPYAVKFIGYPVEKGKYSLDLKYKLANHKLQGQNLLVVDQLKLGGAVESPTATKLPVKLALAILTDRSGKLQIDLPVEGEVDKPDFHFGGLIVQTLLNVLQKAATAPFALLGGLFGASEDLSWAEFEAGSSDLKPAEEAKLQKLAKALGDRPALHVSITGLADPVADPPGLVGEKLDDELIARRRKATPPGQTPPPDDAPLSDGDRSAGLRALFLERVVAPKEKQAAALRAEGKPVPETLVPRRDLPLAEVEPLVKATIEITAEDLAELARYRAETVQELLAAAPGVGPERVFISTAKAEGDKAEAGKMRRALLQLE